MKVLFYSFFQHLFCYSKHSIRVWPKGVIHLALTVNRVLSYSCANRGSVLSVPTPSHPSRYTFFFSSSSSSLFQQPRCIWPDGIFPLYFLGPAHDIKFHRSRRHPRHGLTLYFTCTLVSSSSSVKPNLHGLLSIIIPNESSEAREANGTNNLPTKINVRERIVFPISQIKYASD